VVIGNLIRRYDDENIGKTSSSLIMQLHPNPRGSATYLLPILSPLDAVVMSRAVRLAEG
jgi:hypothetical protein